MTFSEMYLEQFDMLGQCLLHLTSPWQLNFDRGLKDRNSPGLIKKNLLS